MTDKQLQEKIQQLRERWKREPDNRKTIELQAKCLKLALEESNDPFAKEVLGSLG
jgi:hypothetical protein